MQWDRFICSNLIIPTGYAIWLAMDNAAGNEGNSSVAMVTGRDISILIMANINWDMYLKSLWASLEGNFVVWEEKNSGLFWFHVNPRYLGIVGNYKLVKIR